MKWSMSTQWAFLAVGLVAVVLAFNLSTILGHRAWSEGTDTTMGLVDDIEVSTKVRVIRYSYKVGGRDYRGETTGWHRFVSGVPVLVTYAKSSPSVSSIEPETVESRYVTSLIVTGVSFLPLIGVGIARFRGSGR